MAISLLPFILAATAAIAAGQRHQSPPEGMLFIRSGEFFRGRDASERDDEKPRHRVKVSEFYLDETLVTNRAFAAFVDKTHYVSTGERRGYGMVAAEGMPNWAWKKTPKASWRQPFGPDQAKEHPLKDEDPVVSVSWLDAAAYCEAQTKRLPTEAEWEYAARAGRSDTAFPWGDTPERPDGKIGLNFWQGGSHFKNEKKDGYVYLSPVKAFPPNAWGMYDPVGNVWQWVADWYEADAYKKAATRKETKDPKGPGKGKQRVSRGGSWWCSPTTCSGYGLFYRGKASPEAVFNNNGFRCAKDVAR